MKIIFKKIFPIFLVGVLFLIFFSSISLAITAEECEIKIGKGQLELKDAQDCEAIFNQLYQQAGEQRRSLRSEITKFNATIAITTTRIYATIGQIEALEKEIAALTAKIGRLDISLDQISQILIKRITETYKKGKIETFSLFLSSKSFSEFTSRYKYLKVMQLHDRKLMVQMESVRTSFEDQKTLKEKKQDELEAAKKKLESQKILLARQKVDKENLLRLTQNNELRYQQLLAASRAEVEAIQGIIAGRGQETEVGKVNQGNNIATIITGFSACSTGTHLHFQIAEGSDVKNPFSYLKNINLIDDSGGDAHNATGDWDWPLNEPIRLTQGFGSDTSAIRSRIVWYDFHTGIDVVSDDRAIKAVKPGTLYRGSIACGGGTLRYVRVDHDDSGIDTYYLHVNY
ncbi:hypothetical protein CO054_01310 [Candidatus Shapirobacteria bacterium CG_4_9_14_0_2_um_filter_39_11]|uniref:Peptidase M23 domain-containing protein n=1 Tax=Candidatus Shapirobacteria bacterium CG_4_9_14_0_2_um_filter_39_11 TaxID=1974478 RepID=A0A2M8ESY6_9BACT|nr:MAG: hypothetical protein CO054_01310 [Candidatus Shapirobacteria bacterium CG_4_9_14_0_2_um_filter_39_11]